MTPRLQTDTIGQVIRFVHKSSFSAPFMVVLKLGLWVVYVQDHDCDGLIRYEMEWWMVDED